MRPYLTELDETFLRLRRLWSAQRQRLVNRDGRPIELSSLLVLEACARGVARGRETVIADVAYWADVAPSTASRLVDRAVEAKLVRRRPSAESARHTALDLTETGHAMRQEALDARLSWLVQQFRGWDEADVEALSELLSRFAEQIAEQLPAALEG